METNIKRRGRKMRKEIYVKIEYYRDPSPGWSGQERYKTEEFYIKPKCGAIRVGFEGKHGYTEEEIMFVVRIYPATKKGYYYFEAELSSVRWRHYFTTIYNSGKYVTKEYGWYGMLYKTPEEAKEGFLKTWELWIKTYYIRKFVKCYPG